MPHDKHEIVVSRDNALWEHFEKDEGPSYYHGAERAAAAATELADDFPELHFGVRPVWGHGAPRGAVTVVAYAERTGSCCPDFAGFHASLLAEVEWITHLHRNDATGQARGVTKGFNFHLHYMYMHLHHSGL